MKKNKLPAARKGRRPSERAASHTVIMDTVYRLLRKKSVRDLTMEEVAKRARVGKPTLYKWWLTKATLVLAMLCERMAPDLAMPTVLTAEESLRFRVRRLIDSYKGPFGKIVAGLIAEGQSEPVILQTFFDQVIRPRRTATIDDLQRQKCRRTAVGYFTRPAERCGLWRDLLPLLIALGSVDQTVRRRIGRASRPWASLGQRQDLMEQRSE